jgi:putative methyltransferase (TIGR04325 family)
MSVRQLVKSLTPPLLWGFARQLMHPSVRFSGQPRDWAQAVTMSNGYSTQAVIDRVSEATRSILAGHPGYERDSVLLNDGAYPYQILTALLRGATLNGGRLSVIDFGGSLGSTYRLCAPFLEGLSAIQWQIIEQAPFVELGQREFCTDQLGFFSSIDELPQPIARPVILLSSVLQYLERPWEILGQLLQHDACQLAVDRTPMSSSPEDRLCIQHVPKTIYEASYPCWILSRQRLNNELAQRWNLLAEFASADGTATTEDGFAFEFRGIIAER